MNKILLVDDEPFFHSLISELLEGYEFHFAISAAECMTKLMEVTPDLILMDVELTDSNGYEVCRGLKENPETAQIPVFFISGKDDIDEKIKGYDAGGEDYIVKPLDGPEIDRKIRNFLKKQQEKAEREQALEQATKTAMTALHTQGEQGVVIEFLTKSFLCRDLEELAAELVAALKAFGYFSVVQLHSHLAVVTRNSAGAWNALEESILEESSSGRRITEKNDWVIFTGKNCKIMLKKNADEDEEKLGRVRDHVTFVLQGAEARIDNLNLEFALDEQSSGLFNMIKSAHRRLSSFNAQKISARRTVADSIDRFYVEFENNLANIDLTENQEKQVIDATDKLVDQLVDIFADRLNDHDVLNYLLRDLRHMVESQE